MKDSAVKICFAFAMILWFLLFPTTILHPEELIGYLPVVLLALIPAVFGTKWLRFFALVFLISSLIVIFTGYQRQKLDQERQLQSQHAAQQQNREASRKYYPNFPE